jgi:putative ABC transport system substrate-binding protein
MLRREVIILIVGAPTVWQLGARAQQKAMPVIGWLSPGSLETDNTVRLSPFRQSLNEAGFVEARTS